MSVRWCPFIPINFWNEINANIGPGFFQNLPNKIKNLNCTDVKTDGKYN
jgi:hypothetical protein